MFWSIVLLLGLTALSNGLTDYCTLNCLSYQHTMCLYPTSGPSSSCSGVMMGVSLSVDDRKLIVDYHNQKRLQVAKGQQSPQPRASNMLELTYDQELATVAQRWADQCISGHDKCRKSARFEVGQNIYTEWTSASSLDMTTYIKAAIDAWFNEVTNTDPSQVTKFTNTGTPAGSVIGHYTQLAWGSSRRIGCGLIATKDSQGMLKQVLVCNYGPAGNWLNQPIYSVGCPCSGCPSGTSCSKTYPGLCSTAGDTNDVN